MPTHWHLGQVHLAIQAAFAWWNSHLHEFEIGGLSFGDPEQCENGELADGRQTIDEGSIRLTDFTRNPGTRFTYLYDFGDSWRHTVTIERFISLETLPQTARCIDGARARPPEDVDGVPGYERFLAVMSNPSDPEHNEMKQWVHGNFSPDWFDLGRIDKDVRMALLPNYRRLLYQPRPGTRKVALLN